MVFNEIKFSNDLHKIRNISLPSDPGNNYMLFSIDGVIHKYDISTKEMLFSFKASAYRTMQIFDQDNKILTCDSGQVKIWHFSDENTELLTNLKSEEKIEKFYAPKNSVAKSKYYIGVFQDKAGFKVYKDKLNEHWHWKDGVRVTAVDFTIQCDAVLIGSEDGRLSLYDFKNRSLIGDIDVGDGSKINEVWVLDDNFVSVATDQPAVFVWPLGDATKQPYRLECNGHGIICMQTSWNRNILTIGFEDNTIEFWMYSGNQKLQFLKEIKEDFSLFYVDSLCSSMLILNPKGRDIEFHMIEWEWDTKAIEKDLQNINLDFENIKEEDLEDSEDELKLPNSVSEPKGKKRNQTACCAIF